MMRVAICFKGPVSHYRKKKLPLCARKVTEQELECVISLLIKVLHLLPFCNFSLFNIFVNVNVTQAEMVS